MKNIGVIKFYNERYGYIKKDEEVIDFDIKDISFNQKIKDNDLVMFRVEKKFPNIKIARNITKIEK